MELGLKNKSPHFSFHSCPGSKQDLWQLKQTITDWCCITRLTESRSLTEILCQKRPTHNKFGPSINHLSGEGSCFSRGPQTSLSLAMSTSSDWGIPRRSQASAEIWSLHLDLGLPRGLLPAGRAWTPHREATRRPLYKMPEPPQLTWSKMKKKKKKKKEKATKCAWTLPLWSPSLFLTVMLLSCSRWLRSATPTPTMHWGPMWEWNTSNNMASACTHISHVLLYTVTFTYPSPARWISHQKRNIDSTPLLNLRGKFMSSF